MACWTDTSKSYAHEDRHVLMQPPLKTSKMVDCRMATCWVDCWDIQSYAWVQQGGMAWVWGNRLYNLEGLNDEGALALTFNLFETIGHCQLHVGHMVQKWSNTLILMHGCNMLGLDKPKLKYVVHLGEGEGEDLDINPSPFQIFKTNNHWCWNAKRIMHLWPSTLIHSHKCNNPIILMYTLDRWTMRIALPNWPWRNCNSKFPKQFSVNNNILSRRRGDDLGQSFTCMVAIDWDSTTKLIIYILLRLGCGDWVTHKTYEVVGFFFDKFAMWEMYKDANFMHMLIIHDWYGFKFLFSLS